MRRVTLILLGTVVWLGSAGCFVFEELDKGNEIMDKRVAAKRRLRGEIEGNAHGGASDPAPVANAPAASVADWKAKASAWWEGARTLTPGEGGDGFVRCRIGTQEVYTGASECAARRGQPLAGP